MPDSSDIRHMRHALRLAERGLGRTWPNPSVGAVIVKDNAVIAAATTARRGRPHAEPQALAQAGEAAGGATLYVTLEPCSHHGQTPPCTEAIISAGIKRVVAACTDPNPKVSGQGFAQLRAADIEVTQGVCEAEARALNEGFFSRITRGRPFVMLKIATSRDGKIAGENGGPMVITSEDSRRFVHGLRGGFDAILTGIGTVLSDDPQLTCRLPGWEDDSPQRVVLDSKLRIPENAKLLPAWIFTSAQTMEKNKEKASVFKEKGASIFPVTHDAHGLSLNETLAVLAEQGITRLMVEAGSALAGAFTRDNLVDRLYWFQAPVALGEKALPAFKGQDIGSLSSSPHAYLTGRQRFAEDILEIYDFRPI